MELALGLPLLCLMLLGVLQVALVVRHQLAVQLAARDGARAAAVAAAPGPAATKAAEGAIALRPLQVGVSERAGAVTVTVTFVDHTDAPLIGWLLPDLTLRSTVTMVLEPP